MGAETMHASELRRLDFVKSTSESVFSGTFKVAHSIYSTARTRIPVPGPVDAQIKNVESKVTEFAAPKFNQLQDYSGDWLTYADGKVDQAVKSAEAYKGSALGWLRSRLPDAYVNAQEAYTQRAVNALRSLKVDDAVAFVKEKSAQGYKMVTEAPSVVYAKSKETLQKATDVVMKTVTDVWTTVKQSASVDKAIDAVGPTVDFAKQKYMVAHDTIVAQPMYKKTYDFSTDMANKAQSTPLYKSVYSLSATHVYPVISPLADPLVVKAQPYMNTAFEQLKPIAASA